MTCFDFISKGDYSDTTLVEKFKNLDQRNQALRIIFISLATTPDGLQSLIRVMNPLTEADTAQILRKIDSKHLLDFVENNEISDQGYEIAIQRCSSETMKNQLVRRRDEQRMRVSATKGTGKSTGACSTQACSFRNSPLTAYTTVSEKLPRLYDPDDFEGDFSQNKFAPSEKLSYRNKTESKFSPAEKSRVYDPSKFQSKFSQTDLTLSEKLPRVYDPDESEKSRFSPKSKKSPNFTMSEKLPHTNTFSQYRSPNSNTVSEKLSPIYRSSYGKKSPNLERLYDPDIDEYDTEIKKISSHRKTLPSREGSSSPNVLSSPDSRTPKPINVKNRGILSMDMRNLRSSSAMLTPRTSTDSQNETRYRETKKPSEEDYENLWRRDVPLSDYSTFDSKLSPSHINVLKKTSRPKPVEEMSQDYTSFLSQHDPESDRDSRPRPEYEWPIRDLEDININDDENASVSFIKAESKRMSPLSNQSYKKQRTQSPTSRRSGDFL